MDGWMDTSLLGLGLSLQSLPPAGTAAVGRIVAAGGLILANSRIHLLAAVATVIVAVVLLVER